MKKAKAPKKSVLHKDVKYGLLWTLLATLVILAVVIIITSKTQTPVVTPGLLP